MNFQKHQRFLLYLLYAALAAAVSFVLLPGLLPFLSAWLLASLLEPLIRFLADRAHLRRAWAAAAILLVFFVICSAGSYLLLRRLWYEISTFVQKAPLLLPALNTVRTWVEEKLYRLSVSLPIEMQQWFQSALDSIISQITTLISNLSAILFRGIMQAISALPALALFVLTTFLSCFFISSNRAALCAVLQEKCPARWRPRAEKIITRLKLAFGGWLRAQGILLCITFVSLCAGFLLIRLDAAVLLAAGIALLDALPVFGTGTVLLPWTIVEFLLGRFRRGSALLALYLFIWLTRSLLEPKLVSDRAGLHPLVSLFAMYMGFTLFGVAGMILFPLLAVALRQLFGRNTLNL